jgi:hypothetical protein
MLILIIGNSISLMRLLYFWLYIAEQSNLHYI